MFMGIEVPKNAMLRTPNLEVPSIVHHSLCYLAMSVSCVVICLRTKHENT